MLLTETENVGQANPLEIPIKSNRNGELATNYRATTYPHPVEITLLTICRDEAESGHLKDFLRWNPPLFDHLVAYDDSSTDKTVSILESSGFDVFKNEISMFRNELYIRERLLRFAKELYPMTGWFVILDSDEILLCSRNQLESVLIEAEKLDCTGVNFHLLNLWKSKSHFRTDEYFDKVRKTHAWKNVNSMKFSIESGLHKTLHPVTIKRIYQQSTIEILHLGFSSELKILQKFISYKSLGQRGRMLWRLIDERNLETKIIDERGEKLGLNFLSWKKDILISQPRKSSLESYLWKIKSLENDIQPKVETRPLVTLVCLIYSGIDWLEFAYGQLLRLQSELEDGLVEILFCANDPSDEVLEFLLENRIPHIVFRNQNPEEFYIVRVYRAYNYAVKKSKGEYCLLVNSDMAYAPGFLTRMISRRNEHEFLVGKLIESGVLKPGPLATKKNFGKTIKKFDELKFQKYLDKNLEYGKVQGGLYMPLLANRAKFLELAGFPEGNLVPESLVDYLSGGQGEFAGQGEPCIPGDNAFFRRAQLYGVNHFTILDAATYHFQEGEKRNTSQKLNLKVNSGLAIANDSLSGVNGERVLWNVLVDLLRVEKFKVFEWNTGKIKWSMLTLKKKARLNFNQKDNPRLKLQNASYLPFIKGAIRNLALLQDQVKNRALKKLQAQVIQKSHTVITNSIPMINLDSESHFIWQPLPINDVFVNTPLPNSDRGMRTIFVGALDTTKGWDQVKNIIVHNPEIEFLVVSKYEDDFESEVLSKIGNVKFFSRISQTELISLMDTCNFFLLGSPFETQCLAAMEAAMRNLAIVMRPTGLLGESSNSHEFGYFSDNLEFAFQQAIQDYSSGHRKSPREALLRMKFTSLEIEKEWLEILTEEHKESFKRERKRKQHVIGKAWNKLYGVKIVKQRA